MPRFSDVFVYETRSASGEFRTFNNCYLLRPVAHFEACDRIDVITFDIEGMVLMFNCRGDTSGPFSLSTARPKA